MRMWHWGMRAMGWELACRVSSTHGDPEVHNSNRVMGGPRGANLGPSRGVRLKIMIVKSKFQNKCRN